MSVAELLHGYRLTAGLGQQELASRAGVSVRALRNIERQVTRQPRPESVRRLAVALGLSTTERDRLLALCTGRGHRHGLRVEILGPVVLWRGSSPVEAGRAMGRRLLGALALQPRRIVSGDELVSLLWDGRPPRSAHSLLHMYVAQVRRLLEPHRAPRAASAVLVRARHGYRLDIGDEQVDLGEFDRIVAQAPVLDPVEALGVYRDALALWRGPILADAGDALRRHPVAMAAAARRVAAVASAVDLALARDLAAQALAWLYEVLPDEPWHEGLHARLVLALARTGEPAAALRHYAWLRDRLAQELGVAPSAALQAAHLSVLREESQRAA